MEHARRPILITIVLVLMAFVGTIGHAQDPALGAVEGSTWVLADIGSGQLPLPALPVLATFSGGAVEGSAGCNDYRAGYAVGEDSGLDISSVFATRRACEPLVAAQEDEFLAKLQGATRFDLVDGDLVLDYWLDWRDGHYGSMRFERLEVPAELGGVVWRWVRYEDSLVGGIDVADPASFTAVFTERGRLLLATDCLDAEVPYAFFGSGLAINVRGLDLSGCAGDSPSFRLAHDLSVAGFASMPEGQLLLGLFADSGALLFERAP